MSNRTKQIIIINQTHNNSSRKESKYKSQLTIASQPSNQRPASKCIQNSKVSFEYSFNDYLKLTLAKILPYPNIILIPQEKVIVGSEEDCGRLLELAKRELKRKSHKIIRFRQLADIDRIQFELDAQFNAKFYRPRIIEFALKELSKISYFLADCKKLQKKLKSESIVLFRVQKQYQQKCLEQINIIIDQEKKKREIKEVDPNDTLHLDSQNESNLMNNSLSSSLESQIERSSNANKWKKQLQKKQLLQKYINQDSYISESSMTFTQMDTSLSVLSFGESNSNTSALQLSQNQF